MCQNSLQSAPVTHKGKMDHFLRYSSSDAYESDFCYFHLTDCHRPVRRHFERGVLFPFLSPSSPLEVGPLDPARRPGGAL